jgi:hypothetical protein
LAATSGAAATRAAIAALCCSVERPLAAPSNLPPAPFIPIPTEFKPLGYIIYYELENNSFKKRIAKKEGVVGETIGFPTLIIYQ